MFKDKLREEPIAYKIFLVLLQAVTPTTCIVRGFGYEIQDNKIALKMYWIEETIDAKSSEIFLTSDKGWRGKWRIYGHADPDLSMGYYKLKNGKKAVYFRHKQSEKNFGNKFKLQILRDHPSRC
jgi:hypothetical protein